MGNATGWEENVSARDLDPVAIQRLLDHDAEPNRANPKESGTALD